MTHSGAKPFKCQLCSKTFSLQQYLKEHMNTHTKAKPFVCGIGGCTESFRQRGKLCLHRSSHKEYKKKEYRVFARKDTSRKQGSLTNTKVTQGTEDTSLHKFETLSTESEDSNPVLARPILKPKPITDWSAYCLCELAPAKQIQQPAILDYTPVYYHSYPVYAAQFMGYPIH